MTESTQPSREVSSLTTNADWHITPFSIVSRQRGHGTLRALPCVESPDSTSQGHLPILKGALRPPGVLQEPPCQPCRHPNNLLQPAKLRKLRLGHCGCCLQKAYDCQSSLPALYAILDLDAPAPMIGLCAYLLHVVLLHIASHSPSSLILHGCSFLVFLS